MSNREANTSPLTHFDAQGRACMVDVGGKSETRRKAVARGVIQISQQLAHLLQQGGLKKGDAFSVAKVAGILAAKRTGELIPMCHPLGLDHVSIELNLDVAQGRVYLEASASTQARTGVEMEALTALTVAALTFYDMVKAVDKGVMIQTIGLYQKEGGKSGLYQNPALEWAALQQ